MGDKMRAEFEAAYREESCREPGPYGSEYRFDETLLSKCDDGDYWVSSVQAAWWAWQASRKALVVELPIEPSMSMYVSHREARAARDMHARFRLAIASAGVRVKP